MRKFELVYLMLFLQVGVVLTGFIQLSEDKALGYVLVDQLFMSQIQSAQDSIDYITTTFTSINSNKSDSNFATQEFRFCVPLSEICTDKIDILSFKPFIFFGKLINLGLACFAVPVFILLYSTLFAGDFYTIVLYMLLPSTLNSFYYARIIGYFLGLLQSLIILSDIIKSFKGFTVATVGLFLDLDDGTGMERLGLRGRKR